jgi:hypothetical protein
MAKRGSWIQEEFVPKNPAKCMNTGKIQSRSTWEHSFMRYLDEHPEVLQWGSEVISIPYFNPVKNRMAKYCPDFLIRYLDKDGVIHSKIIEIKPLKETMLEHAKSKYDRVNLLMNRAKWEAAIRFCKKAGLEFEILHEHRLFGRAAKK